MAEIGSVIDGKYEILREIGHGGMSVVYLAMDTHLNKQWAVKEIKKKGSGKNDEIIVNSLLAEANLMKRLDHAAAENCRYYRQWSNDLCRDGLHRR